MLMVIILCIDSTLSDSSSPLPRQYHQNKTMASLTKDPQLKSLLCSSTSDGPMREAGVAQATTYPERKVPLLVPLRPPPPVASASFLRLDSAALLLFLSMR